MSNRSSNHRRSRSTRRSYDDDNSFGGREEFGGYEVSQPARPVFSGPDSSFRAASRGVVQADRTNVSATIKWYSSEKGFGFATDADGGDLFVHGAVLRALGLEELAPGARIVVDVAKSERGEKAVALHSVEDPDPSAVVARPASSAPRRTGGYAATAAGSITGTVKWFNAVKGFGFVAPDGGGTDVFVHASALERSGIPTLGDGVRVSADVVIGRSGKTEIGSIRLI